MVATATATHGYVRLSANLVAVHERAGERIPTKIGEPGAQVLARLVHFSASPLEVVRDRLEGCFGKLCLLDRVEVLPDP